MDFQSALETFAEAWVAANAQSALITDNKNHKQRCDRTSAMAGEVPDSSASASSRVIPPTNSPAGAKLLSIHCLVEKVTNGRRPESAANLLAENYAAVPGSSLFRDIVRTVLIKLGYSVQEAASARGALHFRNWKPLPVEGITDDVNATIEDILGDLAAFTTLKITVASYGPSDDLRDKLLHLLVKQSRELLQTTGCPIAQDIIERILTGSGDAPPDVRASFYKWYSDNAFSDTRPQSPQRTSSPAAALYVPPARAPSSKSRLRIYFDPELELPKLNMWFGMNSHPSRQEMIEFLEELNSQPRRLSSNPLDLANIMYWFKNARAAERRLRRNMSGAFPEGILHDYEEEEEESEEDEDPQHTGLTVDSQASAANASQQFKESMSDRLETSVTPAAPLQVMYTSSSGETETPAPNGSALSQAASAYYTSSTDNDSDDDEDDCDDMSSAAPDDNMQAEDLTMPKSSNRSSSASATINGSMPLPSHGAAAASCSVDIKRENDSDMSKSSQSSSGASSPPNSMFNSPAFHGPGVSAPFDYRFPYGGFPASFVNSSAVLRPFFKNENSHSGFARQSHGERQKRHRAFIDPVSEIPKLEQWFGNDTHPSHSVIEQICEDLNRGEFRSRYPKLTPKNIQLWFKNHRAKVKRLRLSQSHPDLCVLASSISQPTY